MKNKNIIEDFWLSNIIEKPSYKVIKFQNHIFNKIKKNCFYYYKCKFCNGEEINALYKKDFQFIQNDITLKAKTNSFKNKINFQNCRFIKKNEKLNLNQITDNSFYYSRFYNDNNIAKKISKKIKRK